MMWILGEAQIKRFQGKRIFGSENSRIQGELGAVANGDPHAYSVQGRIVERQCFV